MKKIPLKERAAVLLVLAMLLTNPLVGQYVNQGIDWAFEKMFFYGAWISIAATVYLMGLGAYYYVKTNKVHIPKAKAGTPKFIET